VTYRWQTGHQPQSQSRQSTHSRGSMTNSGRVVLDVGVSRAKLRWQGSCFDVWSVVLGSKAVELIRVVESERKWKMKRMLIFSYRAISPTFYSLLIPFRRPGHE
jgi:hypothetical protein